MRWLVPKEIRKWGRQCLLSMFIVGATFLAAHTINAYVAYSLNQPILISTSLPASPEGALTTQNPQSMAQEILEGHLFLLPPNATIIGGSAPAPPPPPPMDVAKKVSLLGTVTGKNGEAMAIFEELSTKQQRLYRLHDVVLTVGSLAAIEKDRVLLRQDSQEEWLDLLITKADKGIVPLLTPGGVVTPVAKPVAKPVVEPSKRTLDRRYLDELTSDLPRLLTQAFTMPMLTNGKIDGIAFTRISTSGFFDKIGFQNYDVVRRINGVEILDAGMLISILQQLKQERSVRVDILRNNQAQTLLYEIR